MGIENKLSVEKMDSINNLSASKLKTWASQVVLVVKKMPANAGCERGAGSIPGLERSPGGGHGNPLWYPCLENPMDRGAWHIELDMTEAS